MASMWANPDPRRSSRWPAASQSWWLVVTAAARPAAPPSSGPMTAEISATRPRRHRPSQGVHGHFQAKRGQGGGSSGRAFRRLHGQADASNSFEPRIPGEVIGAGRRRTGRRVQSVSILIGVPGAGVASESKGRGGQNDARSASGCRLEPRRETRTGAIRTRGPLSLGLSTSTTQPSTATTPSPVGAIGAATASL